MIRVARFLHSFVRHPRTSVREEEVQLEVGGEPVPGTYLRPPGSRPLPGWIVLHGITVPGREHPVLKRFAYSLASTGAAVLIPEVPAWRRLELAPAAGDRTIAAAARYLTERDDVLAPNLNLVGFSFGATQALMSAARPEIRPLVRAVIGFGGYCDLGRTLRCMMTGEHEWQGVERRLLPDPYGRWIIVGNYLQEVPELAHMEELRRAALELAMEAGRIGAYAADPVYDPMKAQLRETLPTEQRELWDLIAGPGGVRPPAAPGRELADRLLDATMRRHPGLDPTDALAQLDQRVVLVHGHDDRLIPFTETLRLAERLPPTVEGSVSITRLFAHSAEADPLHPLAYPAEIARYLALLNRALRPC